MTILNRLAEECIENRYKKGMKTLFTCGHLTHSFINLQYIHMMEKKNIHSWQGMYCSCVQSCLHTHILFSGAKLH